MVQIHLNEYIAGIYLINKSDIEEIIRKHISKIGHPTSETNFDIFETLFQLELEKLFQQIEYAAYHSDEQVLLECHQRLVDITRLRGNI